MAYKITSVKYQRNGMGGDGFNVVYFSDRGGTEPRDYIAIAFAEYTEDGRIDYGAYWPRVAVITPATPELAWRGADAFGDVVKLAIGKADADGSAYS